MTVFFSSDESFETYYNALKGTSYEIDLLISESPKEKGRGRKPSPNAAHAFAKEVGLKVLTPHKLDESFIKEISPNEPVIGIVFAYGKIIPQAVMDIFKYGIINIHPSLLPKYRGPSPIQTSLLNNDTTSGYSIIKLTKRLDAGDVLFQEKEKIKNDDNYESLKTRLVDKSSQALPEIIKQYIDGDINIESQDEDLASYTKMIEKSDGIIDKSDDALSAYSKFRAYYTWPKARIKLNSDYLIIHDAEYKDGHLILKKVQKSGKRAMSIKEFVNGHPNLLTKIPPFVKI